MENSSNITNNRPYQMLSRIFKLSNCNIININSFHHSYHVSYSHFHSYSYSQKQAAPAAGAGSRPATAKGRRRGSRAGAETMDVVPVVRQKVAQSLGEGRVKRGAMVDKVN